MRKGFLQPRPLSQQPLQRVGFNRPTSWRPRERPKVAATKIPCAGNCGKWIAMNPKGMCRYCDEQRIRSERDAKLATLARVQELRDVPRDIEINGVTYTLVWNGRGPLPGLGDTPKNLGSSLVDSSPLRQ